MKTLPVIVILIAFNLSVRAQINIDSVWSAGGKWTETYFWNAGQYSNWSRGASYAIVHDSVINGIPYRLLSGKYLGSISGTFGSSGGTYSNPDLPPKILGGIRVDNKKVYFIRTADTLRVPSYAADYSSEFPLNVEKLIYDFDLQVGDTLNWRTGKNIVLAIDSVLLSDNKYARRYWFDTVGAPYSPINIIYWIEGIGSRISMLGSELYLFTPLPAQAGTTQCYNNPTFYYRFSGNLQDQCFYISPNNIAEVNNNNSIAELYPNPLISEVLHLKASTAIADITISDVSGKAKYSYDELPPGEHTFKLTLQPGVYFVRICFDDGTVANRKLLKQ